MSADHAPETPAETETTNEHVHGKEAAPQTESRGVFVRADNIGPRRVGVVDIGSNTVRLVVYEAPTRLPIPVFNEKAQCQLAAGLGRTGHLNPKGVAEALRSLRRFVQLADAMGVGRLEMVATAAVRDAADGTSFVTEVERVCGHPVNVLSGAEEARLAAVGVFHGVVDGTGVLGDLGGGSLDLVRVEHGVVQGFATLPLGHIRLADESAGDRPRAKSILEREFTRVPWLNKIAGQTLFAVGGSWRAMARVFIDQTHHPLHVVDNYSIGFFDALRLSTLIAGLSRPTLEKLSGVDANRVESLPFAAAALAELLTVAQPRQVVFSAFGMREGQMLELLAPTLRSQDPLIAACEGLAERSGRFAAHGQEILDWISPLFPDQTDAEKRLRLAACLLSDIGWTEHPDYRGLHAFHRVLRVPYQGLNHPDRVELALTVLVRYGGSEDDEIVGPVRVLLDERRVFNSKVCGLALRLAHTLSGGAPGLLPQTQLKLSSDRLELRLPSEASIFKSEAVDRRFARLARALSRTPAIA